MIQEIISGIAVILLIWVIKIILKRDSKLDLTLKDLRVQVTLARIDSLSTVRTLIRVSNGIKYKDILKEERDILISEYNFKNKNKD